MIKYVDLTPEHGISEYTTDLFNKEHASLLELGGERVKSVTAQQVIEQGIGVISIRSANSLTKLTVPSFAECLGFDYEGSDVIDQGGSHFAIPAYAKFTTLTDFVPDRIEERSRFGRKKVIERVFPIDYEEGKIGRNYSIAFTEANVGSQMIPLHLLTAMEGPNTSRNPGFYTAFTISSVNDIIIK